MKGILGPKQILTILILLGVNVLLGAVIYGFLLPQTQVTEQSARSIKAQTSARRNEITNLKEEYAKLEAQTRIVKELEARGLYNDQNRVFAQQMIDKMQSMAGLLKARYTISSGSIVADANAQDANLQVISSPVKMEIEALDDMDVYGFVGLLQKRFPGVVDITRLQVTRAMEMTQPALRQIGNGTPVVLVKGSLEFNWKTLAPQPAPDPNADPAAVAPSTMN